MIKGFALILTVSLILGSVALAEEGSETEEKDVLMPDDFTYEIGQLVEEAQYELSEDAAEQAEQQNEFAERRMIALQGDKNGEHVVSLLEQIEKHEGRLCRALEALAANGEESLDEEEGLVEEIMERVEEATRKRSERLGELADDESMPEGARAGASRAIENQENARRKAFEAMENARKGLDKEDVDPEEVREEARERAREHMPEEVNDRPSEAPSPENDAAEEARQEAGEEPSGADNAEEEVNDDNDEEEEKGAVDAAPGDAARRNEGNQPGDNGRGNSGR